jgi:dihydrofolate synthase/folylpolyglutamate synthase
MEYREALQRLGTMTRFGINLGLQRISSLLRFFNNPQEQLSVIHIGGTNGKGSTQAMLSAILKEAGYRVGAFTSPHLISYRERFAINGENISHETFTNILADIFDVLEKVHRDTGEYPTEFEVLTALAFLYFAREKVDIALIEVGLGGDIDSTNVISQPLLSIITNVSLDHTAYLGTTLREIAQRKSGIIKEGCPVLTASREEEVLQVIRQRACVLRAPLREVYQQTSWKLKEEMTEAAIAAGVGSPTSLIGGQFFSVHTLKSKYDQVFLPFWGRHQLENAVTAIMAAEILQELGWKIDTDIIVQGLAQARWPGRLEVLGTDPLLVVDGAHNPAGIKVLSQWLTRKRQEAQRVILVMGMLDDKDRVMAARLLQPLVDMVIITKPNSHRAKGWYELGTEFREATVPVVVIENLEKALEKALTEAKRADLVLVTGSLYLIGEVKKIVRGQATAPN